MAAILNSAILDSAILHKTLTQTNSIWLKLIHSDSTWWWQPSWILPSCIQPFCTKKLHSFILTQLDDGGHLEFCHLAFNHFAQNSDSNSFILSQLDDGSHLELCHLGFTHFVQNSDSNYFNLPQTHSFSHNLMMVTILNSANLNSAILDSTILHKKTSLIHSDSTWWWQPSSIWPSWIQPS